LFLRHLLQKRVEGHERIGIETVPVLIENAGQELDEIGVQARGSQYVTEGRRIGSDVEQIEREANE